MGAWMWYSMVFAALMFGAAFLLEQSASRMRLPLRWVWLAAIVATPVVPTLVHLWPRAGTQSAFADFGASAFDVVSGPIAALPSLSLPFGLLWVIASALAALLLFVAWIALQRQKRSWSHESLDGAEVLTSAGYGPAIVGVIKPAIVVPLWVKALTDSERRLILEHESAHMRARDQVLLATAAFALVLTPWNPMLWLQVRRLRLAIELDCDARVLRSGSDAHEYANLLLEVGRRHSGLHYALTLSEPRSALERRLQRIVSSPSKSVKLALVAAVIAVVFIGGAWRVPVPAPVVFISADGLPPMVSDTPPVTLPPTLLPEEREPHFTPYTSKPELVNRTEVLVSLVRNYPPLLRDAGIGGKLIAWAYVDTNGNVRRAQLKESSGHPALDAAGLKVTNGMKFAPARNGEQPVAVWIQLPIVFATQ